MKVFYEENDFYAYVYGYGKPHMELTMEFH